MVPRNSCDKAEYICHSKAEIVASAWLSICHEFHVLKSQTFVHVCNKNDEQMFFLSISSTYSFIPCCRKAHLKHAKC